MDVHDELLSRVQQGDEDAFQQLYAALAPQILAYLKRRMGEAQQAQEVLQEAFTAVWRRASSFDPKRAGAKTWVFAIARNAAVDRQRRQHLRRADRNDPRWVPDTQPADEALVQYQDAERIQVALDSLPPAQADVLRRCFFEMQSYPEIAASLGVALGTVKSRARLGFSRLRDLLDET